MKANNWLAAVLAKLLSSLEKGHFLVYQNAMSSSSPEDKFGAEGTEDWAWQPRYL